MDSALIILFGLVATSLLLCIALAVAWRRFGREAHAALWSLAYGLSAANWAAGLLKAWLLPADSGLILISIVCSIGSFALIALGFRRRAGLPLRLDAILAAASVTVLFSAMAVLRSGNDGAHRWMVVFFCSAMLVVSAMSLRQRGCNGRRATGGSAFWMLVLFAAYTLGLGGLAMLAPAGISQYQLYRITMLMGVPTGLFGVGLFAMLLLAADLAEELRLLATSDPLTGILNRRGVEQGAQALIAQCRRQRRPLAVVIADLDRFKTVNDRFGHAIGDLVLQRFVAHVNETKRQGDLFGRLGGEEFILLLPDTDARAAAGAMERVRRGLSATLFDLVPAPGVSASFGISELEGAGDTLNDMMSRADKALYESKLNGRDRISLAPVAPGEGTAQTDWERLRAAG